jgi:UDPglucose 6-dehydrogenase
MKISVFGTGYVGLVTGVCFADYGNDVICADIDANKIKSLKEGKSPIYEPGLDEILENNITAERIQFTTDLVKAIKQSDILFIAVGTPSDVDGSADLKYVVSVAETIGEHLDGYKVIVNKSTVPVGTQKLVKETIAKKLAFRGVKFAFDVVSNPEFLREGNAIEDCLRPHRVVLGIESEKAKEMMSRLYEPFVRNGNPILTMDPLSSEMVKYAANAMLATRISFMNEISRLSERVGADIEFVRRGIGTDQRIGPQFLYAGVGYGGSCFPKDVKALMKTAEVNDVATPILKAVEEINKTQRENYYAKLKKALGGSVEGKTVALWGVAFKPGTDDIREAPAIDIIKWLIEDGAKVKAYDPVAQEAAKSALGSQAGLSFVDDQMDLLESVDGLAIVTEWKSFREPDFAKMKSLMKSPIIVDGRNLYKPSMMKELGFKYISVGRTAV